MNKNILIGILLFMVSSSNLIGMQLQDLVPPFLEIDSGCPVIHYEGSKLTSIDKISMVSLHTFPLTKKYNITDLKNLRLNLFNNQLADLSKELFSLTKLHYLSIATNLLIAISEDINNLFDLYGLSLESNRLREVPHLTALSRLTDLNVSNNNLQNLPSLSNLDQLNYLYCNANQLENLSDLKLPTNLQILDFSQNKLKNLPRNLTKLKNLTSLNLSRNDLDGQIPKSPGLATNLKILELAANALNEFPKFILFFAKLTVLDLSENHLSSIPDCIKQVSSLEMLFLAYNRITHVSSAINELKKLRVLMLQGNRLKSLPIIKDLTELKYLALAHNKLESLKEIIHLIGTLEFLDIRNNPLPLDQQEKQIKFENAADMKLNNAAVEDFLNEFKTEKKLLFGPIGDIYKRLPKELIQELYKYIERMEQGVSGTRLLGDIECW